MWKQKDKQEKQNKQEMTTKGKQINKSKTRITLDEKEIKATFSLFSLGQKGKVAQSQLKTLLSLFGIDEEKITNFNMEVIIEAERLEFFAIEVFKDWDQEKISFFHDLSSMSKKKSKDQQSKLNFNPHKAKLKMVQSMLQIWKNRFPDSKETFRTFLSRLNSWEKHVKEELSGYNFQRFLGLLNVAHCNVNETQGETVDVEKTANIVYNQLSLLGLSSYDIALIGLLNLI